jgi:hypothetical protein
MMPLVIFKNGEFDRAIKMNKENTEDVSRGCITVIKERGNIKITKSKVL